MFVALVAMVSWVAFRLAELGRGVAKAGQLGYQNRAQRPMFVGVLESSTDRWMLYENAAEMEQHQPPG